MIRVTVFKKLWTKSAVSSSVHVGANPLPAASNSALGYRDFKILSVRLDAFLMLKVMTSRDQAGSMSRSLGASSAVSESGG
jgi:hypothetical protein